jgi:integrase
MSGATVALAEFLRDGYAAARLDLCADALRQMEISVRLFDRWAGRPLLLSDLSEELLRAFLKEYRRTHAGATTNSKRRHLLALWRCAWNEELLPAPPRVQRIPRARAPPTVPEAWTVREVTRILHAAAKTPGTIAGLRAADWWVSLLMVLYDTGERRRAAMAVASQDLDLPGAAIIFRHRKTIPRWCPLSSDTVRACRAIHGCDRPLVWPWPYSREWLDESLRHILRKAGVAFGRLRGGLFHKFKRTSGTLVEAAGGDGAKHTGTTRKVFEVHYLDPRAMSRTGLHRLPSLRLFG